MADHSSANTRVKRDSVGDSEEISLGNSVFIPLNISMGEID